MDDQEPLLGDATEIGYVPQMPTYQDELDHIEQFRTWTKQDLKLAQLVVLRSKATFVGDPEEQLRYTCTYLHHQQTLCAAADV